MSANAQDRIRRRRIQRREAQETARRRKRRELRRRGVAVADHHMYPMDPEKQPFRKLMARAVRRH